MTLVGFSMGGGEVARYIGTYGSNERVTRVMFASAIPPFLLFVHGDADAIVPAESSAKLASALVPNSKLVVIEEAPHGLNVTHADEFNAELLAFLRS